MELDHLVFATPDLGVGVAGVQELLGVAPAPGGAHPGRGSRNALVGLGAGAYLEIIGPDPSQEVPAQPRPFGIDELSQPRLATWAVRPPPGETLEECCRALRQQGLDLGTPRTMSRRTPQGEELVWKLAQPHRLLFGGAIPFLIDWGTTPHPSAGLESGVALDGLRAAHPEADELRAAFAAMGVDCAVDEGELPALVAQLRGAKGAVELR